MRQLTLTIVLFVSFFLSLVPLFALPLAWKNGMVFAGAIIIMALTITELRRRHIKAVLKEVRRRRRVVDAPEGNADVYQDTPKNKKEN